MSKNPHYTGLQTFSIPFNQQSLIKGDIHRQHTYNAVADINAVSAKQNSANAQNVLRSLIRPKPEGAYNSFLPSYNPPPLEQFDAHTAAKRRSGDR